MIFKWLKKRAERRDAELFAMHKEELNILLTLNDPWFEGRVRDLQLFIKQKTCAHVFSKVFNNCYHCHMRDPKADPGGL